MSRTDFTHKRGSRPHSLRLKRIIVAQIRHISLLAMSYTAHSTTQGTYTPFFSLIQSSSPTSHTLLSEFQPCAGLRHYLSGALAKPPSITSYEPKQLAEYKDHMHFTEDNQLAEYQDVPEHEDLRVKPLFFHLPNIASTSDSAESIVTPPPDSDSGDEQICALLTSPLYKQERKANAERSQVYHSARENLMSSSSQDPASTVTRRVVFKQKSRIKKTFSDRRFFAKTSTGFWEQ